MNYNDVVIEKGKDSREYFRTKGGQWNLSEHNARYQACTHINCQRCGTQNEKHYSMLCFSCRDKDLLDKYLALDLVEWDKEDMLYSVEYEVYFNDEDDIISHCEIYNIYPSTLRLVLCVKSSFNTVNVSELQEDVVHEDWEPDPELLRLENQLNDYLSKASTNTWFPGNSRVSVAYLDSEVTINESEVGGE